jgi:RHS repeat-associated protein
MGEKFTANPVTGTASMSVPLTTSPGRSGFGPQFSLSYDSGFGNGPFGFGWNLSLPAITRKTDKGLPQYQDAAESDVFILSGAEDLVPAFKRRREPDGTWVWQLDADGRHIIDDERRGDHLVRRYRPRIEGLFARIERWTEVATGEIHWRSISRDNVTTLYGTDAQSRVADPAPSSPADSTRVFTWLIRASYDDRGNAIIYEYAGENDEKIDEGRASERNRTRTANRYLKRIKYGNRAPNRNATTWEASDPVRLPDDTWMFEVVFDYGEGHYEEVEDVPPGQTRPDDGHHRFVRASSTPKLPWDSQARGWTVRPDPFSSYRAGFEVRTYRRCRRVLMFHHIPDLTAGEKGYDGLVRSTEFDYDDFDKKQAAAKQPVTIEGELTYQGSTRLASFIRRITQSGYVKDDGQAATVPGGVQFATYLKKSLPPLEFEYSKATIQDEVLELDAASLDNLPVGLDGSTHQWVDLDGEGISGILTEQAGAWFYKRNLGEGRFGPLQTVAAKPSLADLRGGGQQLLDLAGDGQLDLVMLAGHAPGFYERTDDEDWEPFRALRALPNIRWDDPNLRFVDLNGDGHADILVTDDDVFTWYPSLAEEGFGPSRSIRQPLDDEQGPRLVFADGTQSIYLADMCGDGLTDLVRVRNGEVSYWPNLGYGHFGPKVSMDDAPWFDSPDQFDQRRVRLADIDGSGTNDIIYLAHDGARLYFNQSGNRLSEARRLDSLPRIDSASSVMTVDLRGNGTACLVWSSPLPEDSGRPLRYIDLMGSKKPHLLTMSANNLGAETHVQYVPSTKFYLADKSAGRPWITRLPFPVHVVERIETYDHVSRNRFVTRYEYHHGYFDGIEREFRGFGMVEQWDTEEFRTLSGDGTTPPTTNVNEESHVPPVLTKSWFHTGAYLGRDRISSFFAGARDADDAGEYYREPGLAPAQAHRRLLDDTVLPAGISPDEEREACRALKGSMLRQEVYALDGSGTDDYPHGHPYTVTEQNFALLPVQQQGDNRHAVFFAHPRETLSYHYERNPSDPRVSHSLTLEVDEYGNVVRSVAVGYARTDTPEREREQSETHLTLTLSGFFNRDDQPHWRRIGLPVETRTYEVVKPPTALPRFTWDGLHDLVEALVPSGRQEPSAEKTIPYEQWDWRRRWDPHAEPCGTANSRLRLVEHVRTLYRPDDLGASKDDPLALLPLGTVESLALPGETCRLALTSGLLNQVFARGGRTLLPADAGEVLSDGGGARGGYTNLDGRWWIPSGRVFYSDRKPDTPDRELAEARRHFFVPRRYRDPFHTLDGTWDTQTSVDYDSYDLLVRETCDALGNRATAGRRKPDDALDEGGNDYRVLQPRLMMDPNRNCSEVAFDALGLVVGTAVMGKPEDNPPKGDRFDSSFETDLTAADTDAFYEAHDPHVPAPDLLRGATTRIVYGLDWFRRTRDAFPDEPERWEAAFAATLARETHVSDGSPPGGLKVQISFSYSDGFGREIQKKIQAERGPVPQRDANGRIIVGPDGQPLMSDDDVTPRWVGSGWVIFNNKGKPVRRFEPFFTDTHRPDFDVRIGVSPVLFYDPVERLVAMLHPNHTYEKVVFDPWRQATYDVNDTIDLDPRTDADIHGYVQKYFATLPAERKTWLQERIANPDTPPPDTGGADPERDAAVRALKHAGTPTTAHFDSLGRSFLTVADNGRDDTGSPQQYETRVLLDIEGNQREVVDAKDRVVMRYDYDMLGNRVHQASMEAGERWTLNDVTGKPIRAWDSRGHDFVTEYDRLRRPVAQRVRGTDAAQSDPRTLNRDIEFAETEYGEGRVNAIALNLRTRVFRQCDGAGTVTNMARNPGTGQDEAYDFKGNLLRSTQEVAPDYKEIIDWAVAQPAGEGFSNSTTYDALNRPVSLVAPDNSVIRQSYNEASLLNALEANLRGASAATQFVVNIDYNAKGQRTLVQYGNGAETRYGYDPETFRLVHLYTRRGAAFTDDCLNPSPPPDTTASPAAPPAGRECGLQNLHCTYDPAGNITHIRDDARQTVYFDNKRVEPSNDYKYDAVYRLIEATGREHLGQAGGPPIEHSYNDSRRVRLPHPGDGGVMGRYREEYGYDEVGNFLEMIHRGTDPDDPGWTRAYAYNEASLLEAGKESNRLTSTAVSAVHEIYSAAGDGYDAHGSMQRMPQLQVTRWDFRDRLLMSQRQAVNAEDVEGNDCRGERTYYVYDGGGQRVRKVTELATGRLKDERIYVGGFEVYRAHGTNALERETLHVMDDKQRVALVETKTSEAGLLARVSSLLASPTSLIRYQFGNHLGSASLELDDQARIISYEEYTPYGSTSYQAARGQTETPKRYRYTGKERDEESGLYYHGARYYAPWLGRWVVADPAGLDDGVDAYIYARGNPGTYLDTAGTQTHRADHTETMRRFDLMIEQAAASMTPKDNVRRSLEATSKKILPPPTPSRDIQVSPRPASLRAVYGTESRPKWRPESSLFGRVPGRRKVHQGLDLGAPSGTPVHAIAAARVAGRSGEKATGTYGHWIALALRYEYSTVDRLVDRAELAEATLRNMPARVAEISARMHTRDLADKAKVLYQFEAHLQSQPPLRVGTAVRRGQVVGLTGQTGKNAENQPPSQAHRHLEIRTRYPISAGKDPLRDRLDPRLVLPEGQIRTPEKGR